MNSSRAPPARSAISRSPQAASARVGPLAAEVATFEAALVIGQGPPIPIGDAVHMVMERVGLPGAEDLETVADDVCKEGDIAEDTDDVIAMCRACLLAPIGSAGTRRRALLARGALRPQPRRRGNRRRARATRLRPRRHGLRATATSSIVIDYKTDKDVTEDTAEQYALKHHAGQAEVYAQALTAATGLPVREVVFVYCKAGAEVRLRAGGGSSLTTFRAS